jgi:hypothetical protein
MPTAAMASATAVESATTAVETTTAAYSTTAAEPAADCSTSYSRATGKPASAAPFKSPCTKAASSAEPSTAPVSSTEPVEPGSSSDKHAAIEPIRSIVAVRRAGIRCVPVISISASGCSIAAVHGPNSDANSNPNLSLGRRG